ncbi:MAG: hypothetical protein NT072_12990, partial [Deltaproteobacteria bacterium]|nr:hypothetical protein [Deltaproteobacteria bacterium]
MKIGDEAAIKGSPYYKLYIEVTNVTLTAEPDEGYEFDYYETGGAKSYDSSLQVFVDCAISVEARFKSTSDDTGSGDDGGGGCFTRTIMR